MNRKALIFIVLALVVAGAAFFLFSGKAPEPVEEAAATRPAPAPRPAPRAAPPPAATEPAAPTEPARPREPRPRAAAPEAAPVAPAEPAPAADAVTLRVETDVPDAQVFVDRNFIGKAPVTTTEVKPGSHQLNVSASGYEGVAQRIDVKPGEQQIVIKLREVRLNASAAVIHKHRMGSCKGQLTATPQGMQYETTDKDDAFRTTLLDIDTFEVDYLEKNLKIKLKSGKQYNFTDPDGNADRLFVFHRDVEKARERLKKGDPPAAP